HADRGMSRWAQPDSPLLIQQVRMLDRFGNERMHFDCGEYLSIEIEVEALQEGAFPCMFLILLFNEAGIRVTWHLSDNYDLIMKQRQRCDVRLEFDKLLLTGGAYLLSAAIYKNYDALDKHPSTCYDLLSRSFEFRVGR